MVDVEVEVGVEFRKKLRRRKSKIWEERWVILEQELLGSVNLV